MGESAGQSQNGGPVRTDPTFYRSAAEAVAAPPEQLAYVVAFDRAGRAADALTVVDVDEASATYGAGGRLGGPADPRRRAAPLRLERLLQRARCTPGHDMPTGSQRRYLLLPGLRSSRRPRLRHPARPARAPRCSRRSSAEELAANAGYSRPHTLHCGPDGIFLSCLGGADGDDGPGGIALLDHSTFDVLRAWETDRGPQFLGLRRLVAPQPEHADHQRVGHPVDDRGRDRARAAAGPASTATALHFWDLADGPAPAERRPRRRSTRWCSSCARPTTPTRRGGSSAWSSRPRTCPRRCGAGTATATTGRSTRSSRSRPSRRTRTDLPPALQPFGAVPPLVTDIDLSVDDRMLYVSCWGTGELKQYDVSDPATPREVGSVRLGGIVRRVAHPAAPERAAGRRPADGGGQPRRASGLRDELAVRRLGRPVLPGRRRRLDGEDRRGPRGRAG